MTARATRAALALLLGAGASAGLIATTTSSAEAAAQCGGKRATIVSKAKVVLGTFVDDVIVVAGRGFIRVDSGGGHDTICVRTARGAVVTVLPGMGDDVVRVETRTTTLATLDGGRDIFLGGPGADSVSTGLPNQANRDRVLLGGGDDAVSFTAGTQHRRAVVKGGGGRDVVRLDADVPMVVDADRAVTTVKGRVFARWAGFEDFRLSSAARQTFLGSDRAEKVTFEGAGEVRATTRGGDDQVTVHYAGRGGAPAIDTGEGRDLLRVEVTAHHTVGSLVTDRVDVANALGDTTGFGFTGVEDLAIVAHHMSITPMASLVELHGDDGDNRLQGSGCDVRIHGGAGNDELRVGLDRTDPAVVSVPQPPSCTPTSHVYGEAGDDVLLSRGISLSPRGLKEIAIADLLDGGEGSDSANAWAGQDTCVAEARAGCEA